MSSLKMTGHVVVVFLSSDFLKIKTLPKYVGIRRLTEYKQKSIFCTVH